MCSHLPCPQIGPSLQFSQNCHDGIPQRCVPFACIIRYQPPVPAVKKSLAKFRIDPTAVRKVLRSILIAGHVKTVIFPARVALYHVVKVKEFKTAKQVQDRSCK